jgi:pimeloyl-ACP methyl ester carboxylesterase
MGDSGFRVGGVQAGPWWLTMAEKGGKADVVRIYIEGDGKAYITASEPSGNPTPRDPVGLRLAAHDNAYESVIYLARPCQFGSLKNQPCTAETWTSGRFDEQVMDAYAGAIRALLNGAPVAQNSANARMDGAQVAGKRAVLIGYSGGAAIALEVAKRLPQVEGVITVAGNIDPAATNTWHGVAALPTAVSPYKYPGRLASLPVLHIVSSGDEVIPPGLTDRVIAGAGALTCTKVQVVSGLSHNGHWEKLWPVALPRCN